MGVEETFRVMIDNHDEPVALLWLQDGATAAGVRILEDWYTPDSLDLIAEACRRMAELLRSKA